MEIEELISLGLERAYKEYAGGRFGPAVDFYMQLLRVDPDNSEAVEMGSLSLSQTGEHEKAVRLAEKAVLNDPDNFKLYNNLGLVYGRAGLREAAVKALRKAVRLNPSEAFLHTNLAIELKKTSYEECVAEMKKTAEDHPENEHVWFNWGAIVHEQGHYDEAAGLYQRALAVNPGMAVCHYNLSSVYFLQGDYERAWPEYEWRWVHFANFDRIRSRFRAPFWDGESLVGKTIVLYGEQGAGDTIMAARFVSDVKSLGAARVVLLVPPHLRALMASSGADEVLTKWDAPLDYHCSLLSVPGILKLGYKDVGRGTRYLDPVGSSDFDWSPYDGMTKIGLCWAGNPRHPNDHNRSIPLKEFAAIDLRKRMNNFRNSDRRFALFSLQKDRRPHVHPNMGAVDYCRGADEVGPMVDLSDRMKDFNETAKMIDGLDLVITADTSVAHLAGALGKKCLVLLPFNPDWRWGLGSEKTNWYPSVTLCRQTWKDWYGAFSRVKSELGLSQYAS